MTNVHKDRLNKIIYSLFSLMIFVYFFMILSVATLLCSKLSRQLATSLHFANCIRSAVRNLQQAWIVRNLHQVCSSQLASSLQLATCIKSAVGNLHQVCSSQLASSLQFATCIKSAVRNLHQVCSSQLASSLQFATCIKSAVRNLHQVCSSQLASSLQFATCIKSAVPNLQQACSSQLASSVQLATCIKSAVRNLHQVCSSQLASSLLTTCSRLDIIKPEQAMRTHPDIVLMIASCNKPAADLLQLVRFWLCLINLFWSCKYYVFHFPVGPRAKIHRILFKP